MPVIWPWIVDWFIARAEWAAAGAVVACAATNCGGSGGQPAAKPTAWEPRPPISGESSSGGSGRQVVIAADADNQCYLDAFANGKRFHFLLDSGAAGVFFSTKDARRLGYDPAKLSFDHSYSGWGWKVNGATVQLQSLNVAGLVLNNVDAAIDGLGSVTDDNVPLLGSPVLKALNFTVRPGSCTLTVPTEASAMRLTRHKITAATAISGSAATAPTAPVEPMRAANGEPMDAICRYFVRHREVSFFADSAAYCDKYGH
jgi:clan AA aspartic protease (TIGR02281 family)